MKRVKPVSSLFLFAPSGRFRAGVFLAAAFLPALPSLLLAQQPQAKILIAKTAEWKYFEGIDQPPDEWTTLNFDDGKWLAGPSPFSYGETAITTGTDMVSMMNTFLTLYLRKTFTIEDPKLLSRLALLVQYDDGFVAYVNGVEIGRASMPAGPVNKDTVGLDHEYTASSFSQNVNAAGLAALVAGTNVLAVEVHNVSLNSSDMVFIPQLTGYFAPPPQAQFFRGSGCDGSPDLDLGDPIYLLRWKFGGLYQEPGCVKACDVNDDGQVDVSDAVYCLEYLFAGGPAIKLPFPDKGPDPTDDQLPCATGS